MGLKRECQEIIAYEFIHHGMTLVFSAVGAIKEKYFQELYYNTFMFAMIFSYFVPSILVMGEMYADSMPFTAKTASPSTFNATYIWN